MWTVTMESLCSIFSSFFSRRMCDDWRSVILLIWFIDRLSFYYRWLINFHFYHAWLIDYHFYLVGLMDYHFTTVDWLIDWQSFYYGWLIVILLPLFDWLIVSSLTPVDWLVRWRCAATTAVATWSRYCGASRRTAPRWSIWSSRAPPFSAWIHCSSATCSLPLPGSVL